MVCTANNWLAVSYTSFLLICTFVPSWTSRTAILSHKTAENSLLWLHSTLKLVYTHLANINFKKASQWALFLPLSLYSLPFSCLYSYIQISKLPICTVKSPIGLYLYLLTIPETSEVCSSQYFMSLESYYYLHSVSLNENSAPLISHDLCTPGEFKEHLSITHLSKFLILLYSTKLSWNHYILSRKKTETSYLVNNSNSVPKHAIDKLKKTNRAIKFKFPYLVIPKYVPITTYHATVLTARWLSPMSPKLCQLHTWVWFLLRPIYFFLHCGQNFFTAS